MKLHTLFFLGSTLALASVSAMAHAEPTPQPYHYGMSMDIQKVIAMNEPHVSECQVVNATIKFVDKSGELQNVSYPKMSNACLFQN